MRILVINPNTCTSMTQEIRATINRAKLTSSDCVITSPEFGPESLESFYDYSVAAFAMSKLLHDHPDGFFDGVLIACFGDPGLYALKEQLEVPVVGIAEASMATALLLGQSFSILAASKKAVPLMKDMVNQYRLSDRLASVESLNLSVLDIEKDKNHTIKQLKKVGLRAIGQGAEVLILGCAGMTGLGQELQISLQIPVLDPIQIGIKQLELLVGIKQSQSKIGLYKTPQKKAFLNAWYMDQQL